MAEASEVMRDGHDVFLSSCLWDKNPAGGDAETDLKPLREEARRLFAHNGLSLWTWEHWEETVADPKPVFRPASSFANVAIFRTALMESRWVIVFVSSRRGQRVPHPGSFLSYGTFFEIELFFAIALKKPIILFREPGGRVEAPLEELLKIARRSGAVVYEECISRVELPRRSLEVYRLVSARPRSPLARFTTFLARARDPALDFRGVNPFLFGQSLPPLNGQKQPNVDTFDFVFSSEKEPGLPLSERMSRIWLALQELLPFRNRLDGDPELARRWLEALDSWSSAASWFGLHSHLAVSPLVGHAERARLISATSSTKLAIPYGPLSSARYSMARRQVIGMRRRQEMRKVIEEASFAIDSKQGDEAGYLSIIGFALIQNFNPWHSIEPFERSLRRRKQEGDEGRLGEGMGDLGFALFLSGRLGRGVALMREAIGHLERSDRTGAYLRSMRKLEVACRLTGRWSEARELRERRLRLAVAEEYFDQV